MTTLPIERCRNRGTNRFRGHLSRCFRGHHPPTTTHQTFHFRGCMGFVRIGDFAEPNIWAPFALTSTPHALVETQRQAQTGRQRQAQATTGKNALSRRFRSGLFFNKTFASREPGSSVPRFLQAHHGEQRCREKVFERSHSRTTTPNGTLLSGRPKTCGLLLVSF